MFQQIDLNGLQASKLFGYAADVPFFKTRKTVEFKPGLNILYGPNACGKSTILKILGMTMCATQGGVSTVTESAVRDMIDFGFGSGKHVDQIGLSVVHDGQPVIFSDPRQRIGLIGSHFDDDFMSAGIAEVMGRKNLSHGQTTASRINDALKLMEGIEQAPESVIWKINRKGLNDTWAKAVRMVESRLKPQCPKGQMSVLLDEPESNLSLIWQRNLWSMLTHSSIVARCQIIVASHSPFALGIPHANYIDLVPGYREEAQAALAEHFASMQAK
ncbi:AAA family ATPase [Achromobacter xylosoxidans]